MATGQDTNSGGVRYNAGNQYGQITLLPHQVQAVQWDGAGGGCGSRLIGDEMRVGKTPTAIAIDFRLRNELARKQRGNDCTLVVCPKSVIDHWVNMLLQMGVRSERIHKVDLPKKQALCKVLGDIERNKRKADSSTGASYVVINWDTVQTIERELKRAGPWFHIIGDEIHRIKGRTTKRTTVFKKLQCKQKTGLSGTPADNRPEDFWSILHWLKPQEYGSYWSFVEEYCNVWTTKAGYKKIDGVKHAALPKLREAIRPFYIRRRLVDVAGSVPQKQYRTTRVEMGARQRREYNEMQREGIVDVQGGDILADMQVVIAVRLQQMAIGCCIVDEDGDVHISDSPKSPKLDAVIEQIRDEPELGPYIVFAQHHDTIRLLNARLANIGHSYASIIGTDKFEDRTKEVARYQNSEAETFTGTIGSCREGITLSRAKTIIFIDRAWNPNWNRQAEARADDLNSDSPVTIIVLECINSIDEDRRLKINQKGRDTDAITDTRD